MPPSLDIKQALHEGAPLVRVDAINTFFPEDVTVPGTGGLPVPNGDRIIGPMNAVTPHFEYRVVDLQDAHPVEAAYLGSTYQHLEKLPFTPGVDPAQYTVTLDEFRDWRRAGKTFPFDADRFEQYLKAVGFETLWPDHGMAGTPGAELHPRLHHRTPRILLHKGQTREVHPYGSIDRARMEDAHLISTIREFGAQVAFLVGLAEDFCVGDVTLEVAEAGIQPVLISDATAAIGAPVNETETTLTVMRKKFDAASVLRMNSTEFLEQVRSKS